MPGAVKAGHRQTLFRQGDRKLACHSGTAAAKALLSRSSTKEIPEYAC
jgi:hypothetical protein